MYLASLITAVFENNWRQNNCLRFDDGAFFVVEFAYILVVHTRALIYYYE